MQSIFGPDSVARRVLAAIGRAKAPEPPPTPSAPAPTVALRVDSIRSATVADLAASWQAASTADLAALHDDVDRQRDAQQRFLEQNPAPEGPARTEPAGRCRLAERIAARNQLDYLQALANRVETQQAGDAGHAPDPTQLTRLDDELEFRGHRAALADAHRDLTLAQAVEPAQSTAHEATALDQAIDRLQRSGLRRARDGAVQAFFGHFAGGALRDASPQRSAEITASMLRHLTVAQAASALLAYHEGDPSALPAATTPAAYLDRMARQSTVRDALFAIASRVNSFISHVSRLQPGFVSFDVENLPPTEKLITRLQPAASSFRVALNGYRQAVVTFMPMGQPPAARAQLAQLGPQPAAPWERPDAHAALLEALQARTDIFQEADESLAHGRAPFDAALEQCRSEPLPEDDLLAPAIEDLGFFAPRLLFEPDQVVWREDDITLDAQTAQASPVRFFAAAVGDYDGLSPSADGPAEGRRHAVALALGPDAPLRFFAPSGNEEGAAPATT
jgi:hypothetical protein